MKLRNGFSLTGKLVLISTLATAIALSVCGVTLATYDRISFQRSISHELQIDALMLGTNCSADLERGDARAASETLSSLRVNDLIEEAAVYDAKGRLFAKYDARKSVNNRSTILQTEVENTRLLDLNLRDSDFTVLTPISSKGESLGWIYVCGGEGEFFARTRNYFAVILLVMTIAIFVSTAIVLRLQKLVSGPISKLVQTMRQIGRERDYSHRIKNQSNDEIGQLVDGLNEMLGEIETRDRELEDRVKYRTRALLIEINRREEAQSELSSALDRVKAANISKSQFLANMSHEIRTPMNGVIGMTGILLDTNLSQRQEDYARTILGSAESLLAIINDILDFSKGEARQLSLVRQEFDIREVIEQLGKMLAQQARSKNLDLICWCDPVVPTTIFSDPIRLRQVLTNLVGNALKFTQLGEVVLLVRCLPGTGRVAKIEFTVQDSGPGIPESLQSSIFESFTQVDQSSTRTSGGTGLGLSISKQIVELMGGTIEVESSLGHGSTFRVVCEFEVGVAANLPRLDGKKILVAEANQTLSALICSGLSFLGGEVSLTHNADEAWAWTITNDYDLIVADLEITDAIIYNIPSTTKITSLFKLGSEIPESVNEVGRQVRMLMKPNLLRNIIGSESTEPKADHQESEPSRKIEEIRRCLWVDDNRVNQKVGVRLMDRFGFEVQVASDGLEALEFCNKQKFDLIFMDVQMPLMNGLEVTQKIRESDRGPNYRTPIIAVTANAMANEQDQCLKAGMNDFITKPIQMQSLEQAIQRLTPVMEPSKSAA